MTELVHYEVGGGVATITLDSPANRNALSRQLVGELFERLDEAAGDDRARTVVLRSADRVFCSGADLSEAATGSMEEGARAIVDLQRRILTHPLPVVTRLAGPVRAGGLGIVAASDIVVCSEEVTFAFTESRLALAPAVISLTVVPRLTSRAAYDTFLSGRTFDATEAAAMGLVTRTVPDAHLDEAVRETFARPRRCSRARSWSTSRRTPTPWSPSAPGSSRRTRPARRWWRSSAGSPRPERSARRTRGPGGPCARLAVR